MIASRQDHPTRAQVKAIGIPVVLSLSTADPIDAQRAALSKRVESILLQVSTSLLYTNVYSFFLKTRLSLHYRLQLPFHYREWLGSPPVAIFSICYIKESCKEGRSNYDYR
jgi:hypothetical protein